MKPSRDVDSAVRTFVMVVSSFPRVHAADR
jgi:hypothetical protein